jgi:hypothetical protein
MRQIRFDTFEDVIGVVEDWSINVTITSEADGTFMFFGHGEKVATWLCGDEEDDLAFYNIRREPNPTSGYLVTGKT